LCLRQKILLITCSGCTISVSMAGSFIAIACNTYHNNATTAQRRQARSWHAEVAHVLVGAVLGEVDTSLNVRLEALDGFFEELLLVVIGFAENVDSLFSTGGA